MEYVGQYLKKNRIERKLNLKIISNELKISEDLLKDIESDNFPDYINMVFLIGHIRAYAKYLDLDYIELIRKFKIQISYDKNESKTEVSKPIKKLNFFSFTKSLSFASIFIISFSFYYLFVEPNNLKNNYAMTPDVPENLQFSLEEIEMNLALLKKNNQDKNILILDSQNIKTINDEVDFVTTSSVIASLPSDPAIETLNKVVVLKFTNPTWVQLRDMKNKIVISKLMNQGDEFSYNLNKNLSITAGNAGNIIISINGMVKGKAGKAGEVIESLIIDNNFTN